MGLSQTAVIVEFTLSMPRWSKKADDLAREVANNHKASANMHRHTEMTLDKNALKDLTAWESEIRTYHRDHTAPFSDKGGRIIGAVGVQEYDNGMKQRMDRGEVLFEEFMTRYQQFVADARASRGDRFNTNDYPTEAAVRAQFSVSLKYVNAPDVGALPTAIQSIIGANTQATVDAGVNAAKKELLERLQAPIAHMHTKLREYQGRGTGRKGSFHQTLITNIIDIVNLVPQLNVDGDPAIDTLAQMVCDALLKYDLDTLRDSEYLRDDVATKAEVLARTTKAMVDKIEAKMDQFV